MLARYLPSVCRSVTNRYCIETTGRIELVLAWRLPSTYPTLCYKEIRVPPQIFSFWNCFLSSGLENFATACRSRCQQNSSTMELVGDTCEGQRVVAVYYTSVNCNHLSPLLRFDVDLWCNLF